MKPLHLVLALAFPMAAYAEIVDIRWSDGSFTHTAKVAPKKFVEACGKLAKGEKVAWQFTATGALNFNVHYHVGKEVSYPERRTAVTKGDGTLEVALDQDYCWMWTNKGETEVTIDALLRKN